MSLCLTSICNADVEDFTYDHLPLIHEWLANEEAKLAFKMIMLREDGKMCFGRQPWLGSLQSIPFTPRIGPRMRSLGEEDALL